MQTCVHSEVTRKPSNRGYRNGSQSGVCVHVHVEGVGRNAMFYGNMLCMFCGKLVQVQTSPGL